MGIALDSLSSDEVIMLLQTLPSLFLALLTPFTFCVTPCRLPIRWTFVCLARITASLAALLIPALFWFLTPDDRGLASVIEMLSFLWLACLLVWNKQRGIPRSGVVWVFVFLYTISSVLQLITNADSADPHLRQLVSTAISTALLILCSFSDVSLDDKEEVMSARETASFPSLITFSWADKLAFRGWKTSLSLGDFDQLPEQHRGRNVTQRLADNLITSSVGGGPVNVSLKSIIWSEKWEVMSAAVLKLGADALDLLKPLLLRWLLSYLMHDGTENEIRGQGYLIVCLMLLAAVTATLLRNQYMDCTLMTGVRIKAALMNLIYQKSLRMKQNSEHSVGEIVNLVAVDADNMPFLFQYTHFTWSALLQISIGSYLLYQELGVSAFAGILTFCTVIPAFGLITRWLNFVDVRLMRWKDDRMKIMSEVLNGMKIIKLYAWEDAFRKIVADIRTKEMREIRNFIYSTSLTVFIWFASASLAPFLTFVAYLHLNPEQSLDPQKIFYALSIINLIRKPIDDLPSLVGHFVPAYVSVKRMNAFFKTPDHDYEYVTREADATHAVSIDNARLDWDDDRTTSSQVLQDMRVEHGSLVAIIGGVGSGKTSVLSAIIGQMRLQSGRVNISSSIHKITYIPQQAWILNDTLQNNITMGSELDIGKYNEVLSACQLLPDFALLPDGDQTEIGEKGINLSGGQKQRISVARACYSDGDLFLIDDPLSAVDAQVGKNLFKHVFSSKHGILKNKTRILVTNNYSVLPHVDHIFFLEDGRIADSGTFSELRTRLDSELGKHMQASQQADEWDESEETPEKASQKEFTAVPTVLIKEEDRQEGRIKLSILLKYLSSFNLKWLVIILVVTGQVCNSGSDYWLSLWSDHNQLMSRVQVVNNLTQRIALPRDSLIDQMNQTEWISAYALLGMMSALLASLSSLFLGRECLKAARKTHHTMLMRILRSPQSFFECTPVGRILNRFSKDLSGIEVALLDVIGDLSIFGLRVIGAYVMMAIAVPALLYLLVPVNLFLIIVQRFYVTTSTQIRRWQSTTASLVYSHLTESLSGIPIIRVMGLGERFSRKAEERIDDHQRSEVQSYTMRRWISVRAEFVANLIFSFTAALAVLFKSNSDPGLVGLALTYSLQLTDFFERLIKVISNLETEAVSLERVLEYTVVPQEREWRTFPGQPANWPSRGEIVFQDFGVRYRDGLDLAVRDMTAHIREKEKIGVVGRTGAGKSTITLSLFRIIEAATGRIFIDDVDIACVGLHELRSKLTIIPQDPVLFSGSLRNNMDPLTRNSDQQLWQCLEACNMKNFVESSGKGLQLDISEGGTNLSVGQRQLLCLGRALLNKNRILVLDEATAAVDHETDALIQNTIRSEFADSTIITIAHRIKTILDADRVMVMSDGRIAEFDAPSRLLEDPSSLFYSLARDDGIISEHFNRLAGC